MATCKYRGLDSMTQETPSSPKIHYRSNLETTGVYNPCYGTIAVHAFGFGGHISMQKKKGTAILLQSAQSNEAAI